MVYLHVVSPIHRIIQVRDCLVHYLIRRLIEHLFYHQFYRIGRTFSSSSFLDRVYYSRTPGREHDRRASPVTYSTAAASLIEIHAFLSGTFFLFYARFRRNNSQFFFFLPVGDAFRLPPGIIGRIGHIENITCTKRKAPIARNTRIFRWIVIEFGSEHNDTSMDTFVVSHQSMEHVQR
jgi:hypothetical protein